MACSLAIEDLRGITDADGKVTGIRVSGTSEECRRIELRLRCRDPGVGGDIEVSYLIDVTGTGAWEAVVDPPDCAGCGRLLMVDAWCLLEGDIRHPECPPVSILEALPCGNCPRIQVQRTVSDTCVEGRRTVIYTVVVSAPPGVPVETRIDYGDGTASTATRERIYTRSHAYEPGPGTVHPRLEVSLPDGCPSLELPGLILEACPPSTPPPVEPRCPRVSDVMAGPVFASREGCRLVWTATVTPTPRPGTFTWRFDGGTATETSRTPFITRTYGTSGRHWVEVTYEPDDGDCPVSRHTGETNLEGCQPTGGSEGDGCIFARTAALVLMTIGLALFLLSLCLSDATLSNTARIAAGATFLAGLVVFILWLLVCADKPCKPALLLLGLAMLGAGFALIHLAGCCPLFAWLGPALAAAGVGTLLGWRAACDITWCAFFKEIALFNAGMLAVVIFMLVIFFPGCFPSFSSDAIAATILAVMDLAFAGVAVRALTCDGRIGDINHMEEPGFGGPEMPDDG